MPSAAACEALLELGRAPRPGRVGVARQEVRDPAGQQHQRGAPRGRAVVAEERAGRELHQRAAAHQVAHAVGRALDRLGPLGVGEDRPGSPGSRGRRSVCGSSIGQPWKGISSSSQRPPPPTLAGGSVLVVEARQVARGRSRRPASTSSGTPGQVERLRAAAATPSIDRARVGGVAVAHVGRADHRRRCPRRAAARAHLDRARQRARPVVERREEVRVEVDHSTASVAASRAPPHGRADGVTGSAIQLSPHRGALAQLGERLDRTQEVSGSNPLCSTSRKPRRRGFFRSGRAEPGAAAGAPATRTGARRASAAWPSGWRRRRPARTRGGRIGAGATAASSPSSRMTATSSAATADGRPGRSTAARPPPARRSSAETAGSRAATALSASSGGSEPSMSASTTATVARCTRAPPRGPTPPRAGRGTARAASLGAGRVRQGVVRLARRAPTCRRRATTSCSALTTIGRPRPVPGSG